MWETMVRILVLMQGRFPSLLRTERKRIKLLTCVRLFETPWTVTHQAPLSKEFSRQEHWSGSPFPSPGWEMGRIFPNQGSNLGLLHCRQILYHLSHQATLKRRIFLLQRMLPPTVRCEQTRRLWSPRSGPALFGFWGRNKCEAGRGCPSQVMLHDNSFCELTGPRCHEL